MLLRAVVIAAVVPLAASATAAPLCKYKIEIITPAIADYDWCFPTQLSDKGHVVGTCSQELGEEDRVFRYLDGITTNVGVLPGFNQGHGFAVNNHGDVVGFSGVSFDPFTNDAFYYRDGTMFDLETWASFAMGDTIANDVNDAGEIVGTDNYDQAVYWAQGQDAIYLPGEFPTHANAINDAGQIVGSAYVGSQRHVVRWDNFELVDLGTLSAGYAEANDIADSGTIAGSGVTAAGPRGFLYRPGHPGLEVIGTLGGTTSTALGVTSDGTVVGNTTTAQNEPRGYVWRKGTMYDLSSLLNENPSADPWVVYSARTINDQGEILVTAYNHTDGAYMVLHPQSCALSSSRACCPF